MGSYHTIAVYVHIYILYEGQGAFTIWYTWLCNYRCFKYLYIYIRTATKDIVGMIHQTNLGTYLGPKEISKVAQPNPAIMAVDEFMGVFKEFASQRSPKLSKIVSFSTRKSDGFGVPQSWEHTNKVLQFYRKFKVSLNFGIPQQFDWCFQLPSWCPS